MKFVLATKNQHKLQELQTLLANFVQDAQVLSLAEVGVVEEIEENGTSFEENALIKARAAAVKGCIGIGDDSGLTVDALDGAPGIYSARYASMCGEPSCDHNDAANNRVLLKQLENVPREERGAAFVCAVACVFPDGEEWVVRGEARGVILDAPQGEGGFGYDPLFYYEPLQKTFAALCAEEKNRVSHRGCAMRAMAARLEERLQKEKPLS